MGKKSLVWDLPLRIFHWLFAVSILASWYTSEQEGEMVNIHMQLGYFILGLVIFRLVWGFVGAKHSRFSQFFPTPSRIKTYIAKSNSADHTHYAGHNPLGSLMVFLMIVLVLLQAISGLFINDDIFSSGPYYGTLSEEMGKVMKYIHHNAFDFMIIAMALHIAAIVYYKFYKKIDLVTPMITGKKPAADIKSEDVIPHSKMLIGIVLAIAIAAFIYWLVIINAPVEESFYY